MRSLVPKLLIAAAIAMLACVCAASASAAPAVSGIFPLGTEIETNNKITAGPEGNMWFTLPGGKDVGDITPAGIVQEFELPGTENPIGIASGPEGRIWVVATGKATGFLPSDPKGTEVTFASALINAEPNIVLGPEGMFWVASNNEVAKFAPANIAGTIKKVTLVGELSPKDIDVAGSLIVISDNDKNPVTELGRVVTFTADGVQNDISIPGPSQGLAGAPSGQVGYSAAGAEPEQAGLITPPAPASAFELLGDPFGVAYGSDQAFWMVQFAKGQLARLTTTGQVSALGGLPIESARQIAAGPNNTLWVTLTKKIGLVEVSAIARVTGLEPPVVTPPAPPTPTNPPGDGGKAPTKVVPDTRFGKKPAKVVKTKGAKATVRLTFSSTVPGAEFQCRITQAVTGKKRANVKPPLPPFAPCRSPRVLHLRPNHYRFAVRSVVDGVVDATPVEIAFSVIHQAKRPRHR